MQRKDVLEFVSRLRNEEKQPAAARWRIPLHRSRPALFVCRNNLTYDPNG